MVFSSLIFLFAFLPIFFTAYFLVPRSWRNHVILLFSCLFYAWGEPKFLFFLLFGCTVDYLISRRLYTASMPHKRWYLIASLVFNLGVLVYAKYANFFIGQYNFLAANGNWHEIPWRAIALPLGISFFTFHKISYMVDIYRGMVAPAKTIWNFFLYILLFPQLIAGPIVRYHDVADQIEGRSVSDTKEFAGIIRFCLGLGKKVLIANPLGQVASLIFAMDVATVPPLFAWIGILCYAMQIYFDFSGYSDMAIGIARILGFRFLENFNHPYIATSITDFWRRWHISLSNFMKEYVYIPLGGNRVSGAKVTRNILIVFALSGIWHGANWTFLVWGVYQGVWIAFERTRVGQHVQKLPGWIRMPWTFFLVLIGWVFFRSDTITLAFAYLSRMFAVGELFEPLRGLQVVTMVGHRAFVVFIIACLISFLPASKRLTLVAERFRQRLLPVWELGGMMLAVVIFCLSVLSLVSAQFNPFIYFRF